MRVIILGAHNAEAATERLSGVLVDGLLALDAGSLTRSLTPEVLARVRHVFLTHRHFDHIRDIPGLAHGTEDAGTIHVYGLQDTLDALTAHLLNGVVYPPYHQQHNAMSEPRVALHPVHPRAPTEVLGFTVLPVAVPHTCPAIGYLVERGGRSIFYTGDTGSGLAGFLPPVRLDLLVTEVSYASAGEEEARQNGHLTPEMLRAELNALHDLGNSPKHVVAVHMGRGQSEAIEAELDVIAAANGWRIEAGRVGMVLDV